jgi:hypothetical protein
MYYISLYLAHYLLTIMTVIFLIKIIKSINYRPHDLYNSVPSEPFYGE